MLVIEVSYLIMACKGTFEIQNNNFVKTSVLAAHHLYLIHTTMHVFFIHLVLPFTGNRQPRLRHFHSTR